MMRWLWCSMVAVLVLAAACKTAPVMERAPSGWPVVLVHGFGGSSENWLLGDYFRGVRDRLRADGVHAIAPSLPKFASSEERAKVLKKAIDDVLIETAAPRVHVIGHSQGGLDGRYLIEQLGYAEKIGSITTIGSPHEGTPIALIFDPVPDPLVDLALSTVALAPSDGAGAVHTLSGGAWSPAQERTYPVPAFSFAGLAGSDMQGACKGGLWGQPSHRAAPQAWLIPEWMLINASQPGVFRANDGLVPVDSARWQHFLGCLPADHVALIGLGGLAFEGEDMVYRADIFFGDYVQTLRVLERGGTAADVVSNPSASMARLLH